MIYPNDLEAKIGFNDIRTQIASLCQSALGEERVQAMQFTNDAEAIRFALSCTQEYCNILTEGVEFPTEHYRDLRRPLQRIRPLDTYLTEDELFDLLKSLHSFNAILSFLNTDVDAENTQDLSDSATADTEPHYRYPHLQQLTAEHQAFPALTALIDKVVDKFGLIRDNASPQLYNIRRQLEATERSISATIHSILRKAQAEGYAEKEWSPTIRDGRLVIPIIPSAKRRVRGIVHDESATGKTLYVEPSEIVEANNQVRELQAAERREVIKVLQSVASEIRPHIDAIHEAFLLLGEFDFLRAKSLWSITNQTSFPRFSTGTTIRWYEAIHPLLRQSLNKHGKQVVPLNIDIGLSHRIVLISGPNAGGKSVCLKTVGLLQYMWQCGIPVPVHPDSEMGLFSSIFIDIGDGQDLENELSTYSGHLTHMKHTLKYANQQSLLLIDEFGGGTEPTIGGAIAEAILTRFVEQGCYGVITTHYQNLKLFADSRPEIANAAMLYDRQQMHPLFTLEIGHAGNSFALEIAQKIGLPHSVVAHAKSLVGNDYTQSEKYLQDIARDKRYWETKRQKIHQREKQLDELVTRNEHDIKQLEARRKSIIDEAKAQADALLKEANAQIERTILEIREAQAEKERTKQLRSDLTAFRELIEETPTGLSDEAILKKMQQIEQRKQRREDRKRKEAERTNNPTTSAPQQASPHTTTRPLSKGDSVRIKGQQSIGIIEELKKQDARVRFGDVLTTVKLKALEHATQAIKIDKRPALTAAATFVSKETREVMRNKRLNFKQSIDVRGLRATEAIDAVMQYIDEATMVGGNQVRILHGTGTGALKIAIRQMLATMPTVAHFQDEHVQFGGAGITVVDLA